MAFDKNHFEKVNQEVMRHLEDTEVSKLAHWSAAAVYKRRQMFFIGLPATFLSILLTWLLSSDFQSLAENSSKLKAISEHIPVFMGLVISLLSGLGTFLNFNELSIKHRTTAENLHSLWRDCKNWDTDFPDESSCEKAVSAAQQYRKRLNDINRDAPQIPKWAWKSVKAQRQEGSVKYQFEKK
ncbi:SLATT domain-containing protein [Vibrio splendidus]|uniref:SLATT domain-containing protein n=1 Tax=Vibrio splendidus TaxID=29497 RepID=A0ABV4LV87_VIBSP